MHTYEYDSPEVVEALNRAHRARDDALREHVVEGEPWRDNERNLEHHIFGRLESGYELSYWFWLLDLSSFKTRIG